MLCSANFFPRTRYEMKIVTLGLPSIVKFLKNIFFQFMILVIVIHAIPKSQSREYEVKSCLSIMIS